MDQATKFNLALTVSGGIVLALGLTVGYVKNRLWISEPLICLATGVVLGPALLGLLDFAALPVGADLVLKEAARVTLALAVLGAALRLPRGYETERAGELAIVLIAGMTLMWGLGSLTAWITLGFAPLTCLLIGAIVSPTDPVVAASVVTGKVAEASIPSRMRNILSAESGANDGLGLLFVLLPVLLITRPDGEAWTHWLTRVLLWEIAGAAALGAAAGWVAGKLLLRTRRRPLSERESTLTISIALAVTLLGVLKLMHSDGILGAFVAGLMLNRTLPTEEFRHERVQEAISRFFDLPVFVLLGIALPFGGWLSLGWPGAAFAILLLLLRRIPVWLALGPFLASVKGRRDALFAGWFGPIGIASAYYAIVGAERVGDDRVWYAVSLAAFTSIVVHGITATPLARRFGGKSDAEIAGTGEAEDEEERDRAAQAPRYESGAPQEGDAR